VLKRLRVFLISLVTVCASLGASGAHMSASAVIQITPHLETTPSHTCLLSSTGQLRCWGGISNINGAQPFVTPTDLGTVSSFHTNQYNTCAITTAQSLRCWGYLGYTKMSVPDDLGAVIAVDNDTYNVCAIAVNDVLHCWGTQYSGTWPPTQISVPSDIGTVTAVDTNDNNTCAITSGGSLRCWGYQANETKPLPIVVPNNLGPVRSVQTNQYNTCVITAAGALKCWGVQYHNPVKPLFTSFSNMVVPTNLGTVISVQTNEFNTCAILTSGRVKCWGTMDSLDAGTAVPSGMTQAQTMDVTTQNACTVLASGALRCWGFQSGATGITDEPGPFLDVATSRVNTCALRTDGRVRCWGWQTVPLSDWDYDWKIAVPADLGTGDGPLPPEVSITSVSPHSVTASVMPNEQESFAISGYDALVYRSGEYVGFFSPWASIVNRDATSGVSSIDDLCPRTDYRIVVRAERSGEGWYGLPSSAIDFTTPDAPPTAPQISAAVSGDKHVTLTLTPPSELSTHGQSCSAESVVSGYEYSIDNGASWSAFASVDGPFTVGGLSNGTTYQVKVRAVNSSGTGTPTANFTVYPTNRVPGAPKLSLVSARNAQITLQITPPTDGTAQSITSYQYARGVQTTWNPVASTNGQITLTGANGVPSRIWVRAVNANGTGAPSPVITAVPVSNPSPPTIYGITGGNGKASVGFTPSQFNGGSPIIGYQYSLDGGSTWSTSKGDGRSPRVIAGLTNGVQYQMALRAVTKYGAGDISNVVAFTPKAVPSAPTCAVSNIGRTSIQLKVNPPTYANGSAVTSYAYTLNSGFTWTSLDANAITSPVSVTGLTPNQSYRIQVKALNDVGSSALSSAKSFKTLK
jgi:Fibronectin type III domain/Regulator of chromosome condensation (RCC1) repeat